MDDHGLRARWTGRGPWRVEHRFRWTPLPHLAPRWRLTIARSSRRLPTLDGAFVAARALLAWRGDPAAPPARSARLALRLGVEPEVSLVDAAGRLAWRGSDDASLRTAARAAAGWIGPPPARARPLSDAQPGPSGLSEAQRRVVEHPGGPALVVAVAGAGKTTTMVARVAAVVAAGTPPERVLVTSFSRAAVADVGRKLARAGDARLAAVEVRTFHSLAYRILLEADAAIAGADAPPAPAQGRSAHAGSPPPEEVAERVLDLVIARWRRDGHPLASELRRLDRGAFLDYRARCLAQLALPDPDALALPHGARARVRHAPVDASDALHLPLLRAHDAERRDRAWRDHDDLVIDAWLALEHSAPLRERLRRRWSQRIVDECQDVNPAQVALLEALLDDDREVMLIGDDDQSIYGFRGSDPDLVFALADRLGARRYLLDHNYRGRPEPLAAAAGLTGAQGGRTPKRLRAARPPGGSVTLDACVDPEAEAARVAERLRDAYAAGFDWGHHAVLLRRFAQAPPIELALLRARVPYALLGAPDVLTHAVSRAALAGLHLAAIPDAPPALRARAWRRWLTGLGLAPAQAASAAALLAGVAGGSLEALERAPMRPLPRHDALLAAGHALRRAADGDAATALRVAAEHLLPWPRHGRDAAVLDTLARAVGDGGFGPVDETGAPAPHRTAAPDHRAPDDPARRPVRVATLLQQIADHRRRRRTAPAVTLTSAHRSKGLEWDVVAVPGQALGTFPLRPGAEERRLAYVAWTRARERLHLLRDAGQPPSPYLAAGGVGELVRLLDDLAWLETGTGAGSAAARWATLDARRRLGHPARSPGEVAHDDRVGRLRRAA